MRKNILAVIRAYEAGRSLTHRSCSTDGRAIYSYGTCIMASRADGTLLRNVQKFSATTSSQQAALRYFYGNAAEVRAGYGAGPAHLREAFDEAVTAGAVL